MKIVFWSCVPGHASVTGSMCAIAAAAAVYEHVDCSLLQAQYNNDPLINQFFSNVDSEVATYLGNSGVDSLMRNVRSGALDADSIRGCTFSFARGKLNVFAGTNARNKNVFDNEITPILSKCMQALDSTFEISFLDAQSGHCSLSVEAIKSADLVVVCLPQNNNMLEYLFNNYKFPKDKVFYLFGDYDSRQICNIKNLIRKYHGSITQKNVGCIPHSTEYADALNTGKLISFFVRNEKIQKPDENQEFFVEVRKATSGILQYARKVR